MRRLNVFILASALAVLALVAGCASIDPIEAPAADSGTADFTRLVALGNSLTAGFQNNGLVESRQNSSYAALVARQMGKEVLTAGVTENRPEDFVIPGYSAPGTDGTLELTSILPPTILPVQGSGNPVNLNYPGIYNAMGVPGADANDVVNTLTSTSNPIYDLVLRQQGSTMLQQAAGLQPTFVLLWVGNNDALKEVTRGSPATEVAVFEQDYRTIVTTLHGLPTNPGIVAGNIPDVTTIPFTTTVPPFVVAPNRQPVLVDGKLVPLIGPDGPLTLPGPGGPGDLVTLGATPLLAQGIGIPSAIPGGTGQPLPGAVVLTPAEITHITQRVADLNQVIDDVAAEFGYPVADTHALLTEVAAHGLELGGFTYTKDLVTGGVFSLDGIHPTDMGHAFVANLFIETINEFYGANLQPVDMAGEAAVDFGPVAKPGMGWWLDAGTAAAYEAMMQSPVYGPINDK